MREVIVAGNWKMHTTPADAPELARTIESRTRVPGVTRVLCPPFVCLAPVRDALAGDDIGVGAQDVHDQLVGAYTGDISAPMLAGLATWVIVGHSERRRYHHETNDMVGEKLARAVESGLRPILCVGEELEVREEGAHVAEALVADQVADALQAVAGAALAGSGLVIAYEPVWAIGTGRNASGADAAAMAQAIRRAVDLAMPETPGLRGTDVPVLYGGSVTAANIDQFFAEAEIDGALVGGASLKPDEMAAIVARAGLTAAARGLAPASA
ncbi:MAG TPA: triose-phosphate isomerase [Candidatus Limnocylindrales bacterium]|nr:triose-phosphate isomerase [Candidatus Limnocylindrales bacterium]